MPTFSPPQHPQTTSTRIPFSKLPLRWPEQKPSSLPEKMEADETARCLCTIPAAWSYPNQSTAGQARGLNPASTTSPPTGNHYRASTCQTSCLTPTQRATSSRRLYRRRLPVVWKPAGEQLVVIHRKKNQIRTKKSTRTPPGEDPGRVLSPTCFPRTSTHPGTRRPSSWTSSGWPASSG